MAISVLLEKYQKIILDLGFRQEAMPQLKAYIELLWAANAELNLISRQMSLEELITNHLIDCLLPLSLFPKNLKNVADFGSGGGLPAVIYAIHFSAVKFHLYEKSPKKQEFLRQCQPIAPNLLIHAEIPNDLPNIDLVIARAFKPLDVILDISRSYFQNQGKYFLLKGRLEKIDEELQLAKKKFKDLQIQVIPLKSPLLEVERHVILI